MLATAKMVRFISVLLLCTTDVLHAKITLRPSTLYVFVGQTARFNCSTDNLRAPADWRFKQYGSPKTNAIFESGFFKSSSMGRYEIDGRNDLVILNVRLVDAGIYICLDDAGKGERAQAELVIIETDPACSSNITSSIGVLAENSCHLDPDYIEFRCSVKYRGNQAPVLELEWLDRPTLEFINGTGDILLENANNQLLVINRFVAQGSTALNGSSAICRLKNVTSTPRNNITCSMPVFNILYASNSSERRQVKGKLPGGKVTPTQFRCTVDTNIPDCRFSWKSSLQNLMQDTHLEQPVIYLNSSENKVQTKKYECFADCTVSGKHCIIEGMKIDYIPADDDAADTVTPINASDQGILQISMTVIGIVLLLIIIFLVIFRKKIPLHKCRCWKLDHEYNKLKETVLLKRTSIDGGKLSNIPANKRIILPEVMDVENGLIERLFLKNVLTSKDMNKLSSATYLKNRQRLSFDVLKILYSRFENSSDFGEFLNALDESGQTHVKVFITGESDENCSRPLEKNDLKDIDRKFPSLIKYLDSSERFLKRLMDKNCITQSHLIRLSKCTSEQERNTELLQIMRRRSYDSFLEFQNCLKATNQDVVMKLLVENPVVVDKPGPDVTGSGVIKVQVESSPGDSGLDSVSSSRQHSESSAIQHESRC